MNKLDLEMEKMYWKGIFLAVLITMAIGAGLNTSLNHIEEIELLAPSSTSKISAAEQAVFDEEYRNHPTIPRGTLEGLYATESDYGRNTQSTQDVGPMQINKQTLATHSYLRNIDATTLRGGVKAAALYIVNEIQTHPTYDFSASQEAQLVSSNVAYNRGPGNMPDAETAQNIWDGTESMYTAYDGSRVDEDFAIARDTTFREGYYESTLRSNANSVTANAGETINYQGNEYRFTSDYEGQHPSSLSQDNIQSLLSIGALQDSSQTYEAPTTPSQIITIGSGDYLGKVAQEHNTDVATIMSLNPQITDSSKVGVGDTIIVPTTEWNNLETSTTSISGVSSFSSTTTSTSQYTIKSGDTLYGIALQNGLTVSELQAANSMGTSTSIKSGENLMIPPSSSSPPLSWNDQGIELQDGTFLEFDDGLVQVDQGGFLWWDETIGTYDSSDTVNIYSEYGPYEYLSGSFVCFLANTQITMQNNSTKNIQDIKVSEQVLSYDTKTKEIVAGEVLSAFTRETKEYFIINNKIKVTPDHPFYVNGNWLEIKKAQIGDILLNSNNQKIKITLVEYVKETVPVYNLKIKQYHNYFAEDVLVHNADYGVESDETQILSSTDVTHTASIIADSNTAQGSQLQTQLYGCQGFDPECTGVGYAFYDNTIGDLQRAVELDIESSPEGTYTSSAGVESDSNSFIASHRNDNVQTFFENNDAWVETDMAVGTDNLISLTDTQEGSTIFLSMTDTGEHHAGIVTKVYDDGDMEVLMRNYLNEGDVEVVRLSTWVEERNSRQTNPINAEVRISGIGVINEEVAQKAQDAITTPLTQGTTETIDYDYNSDPNARADQIIRSEVPDAMENSGNYEVTIGEQNAILARNGYYYGASDVDENFNPISGASRITMTEDTTITVISVGTPIPTINPVGQDTIVTAISTETKIVTSPVDVTNTEHAIVAQSVDTSDIEVDDTSTGQGTPLVSTAAQTSEPLTNTVPVSDSIEIIPSPSGSTMITITGEQSGTQGIPDHVYNAAVNAAGGDQERVSLLLSIWASETGGSYDSEGNLGGFSNYGIEENYANNGFFRGVVDFFLPGSSEPSSFGDYQIQTSTFQTYWQDTYGTSISDDDAMSEMQDSQNSANAAMWLVNQLATNIESEYTEDGRDFSLSDSEVLSAIGLDWNSGEGTSEVAAYQTVVAALAEANNIDISTREWDIYDLTSVEPTLITQFPIDGSWGAVSDEAAARVYETITGETTTANDVNENRDIYITALQNIYSSSVEEGGLNLDVPIVANIQDTPDETDASDYAFNTAAQAAIINDQISIGSNSLSVSFEGLDTSYFREVTVSEGTKIEQYDVTTDTWSSTEYESLDEIRSTHNTATIETYEGSINPNAIVSTDSSTGIQTVSIHSTEQVSDHFSYSEFNIQASNGPRNTEIMIDPELVNALESVRSNLNSIYSEQGEVFIQIDSGYRNEEYNAQLTGASSESRHTQGMAADIRAYYVDETGTRIYLPSTELANVIDSTFPSDLGIAPHLDSGFVHLETLNEDEDPIRFIESYTSDPDEIASLGQGLWGDSFNDVYTSTIRGVDESSSWGNSMIEVTSKFPNAQIIPGTQIYDLDGDGTPDRAVTTDGRVYLTTDSGNIYGSQPTNEALNLPGQVNPADLITVDLIDTSLENVFAMFDRLEGVNQVSYDPDIDLTQEITLTIRGITIEEAFESLSEQIGSRVTFESESSSIQAQSIGSQTTWRTTLSDGATGYIGSDGYVYSSAESAITLNTEDLISDGDRLLRQYGTYMEVNSKGEETGNSQGSVTATTGSDIFNELSDITSTPDISFPQGNTESAQATMLIGYYNAIGEDLPTVSERAQLYAALDLGDAEGYEGTSEQNTNLLEALQDRDATIIQQDATEKPDTTIEDTTTEQLEDKEAEEEPVTSGDSPTGQSTEQTITQQIVVDSPDTYTINSEGYILTSSGAATYTNNGNTYDLYTPSYSNDVFADVSMFSNPGGIWNIFSIFTSEYWGINPKVGEINADGTFTVTDDLDGSISEGLNGAVDQRLASTYDPNAPIITPATYTRYSGDNRLYGLQDANHELQEYYISNGNVYDTSGNQVKDQDIIASVNQGATDAMGTGGVTTNNVHYSGDGLTGNRRYYTITGSDVEYYVRDGAVYINEWGEDSKVTDTTISSTVLAEHNSGFLGYDGDGNEVYTDGTDISGNSNAVSESNADGRISQTERPTFSERLSAYWSSITSNDALNAELASMSDLQARYNSDRAYSGSVALLNQYLGDYAYDAISEYCTSEWSSSTSTSSSNTTNTTNATTSNATMTNTTNTTSSNCDYDVTTATAQYTITQLTNTVYHYDFSWTIQACKEDLTYSIYVNPDEFDLGSGSVNYGGDVGATTDMFDSPNIYTELCLQVSDTTFGTDGLACFQPPNLPNNLTSTNQLCAPQTIFDANYGIDIIFASNYYNTQSEFETDVTNNINYIYGIEPFNTYYNNYGINFLKLNKSFSTPSFSEISSYVNTHCTDSNPIYQLTLVFREDKTDCTQSASKVELSPDFIFTSDITAANIGEVITNFCQYVTYETQTITTNQTPPTQNIIEQNISIQVDFSSVDPILISKGDSTTINLDSFAIDPLNDPIEEWIYYIGQQESGFSTCVDIAPIGRIVDGQVTLTHNNNQACQETFRFEAVGSTNRRASDEITIIIN